MPKVIETIESTDTKVVTEYRPNYDRTGHTLLCRVAGKDVDKAIEKLGEGNYRITVEKI